jgi:hypothetical protein
MTMLHDPVASQPDAAPPPNPVGTFVRDLYSALTYADPQLAEFAYSLSKQLPPPSGYSTSRLWREHAT